MKKSKMSIYYILVTVIFLIIAWFKCIPLNPFLADGLTFIIFYCFFISIGIAFGMQNFNIGFMLGRRYNLKC